MVAFHSVDRQGTTPATPGTPGGTPPATPPDDRPTRKVVVYPGYSVIVGCGSPRFVAAVHRNIPVEYFHYDDNEGTLAVYGDGPQETADYLLTVIFPGVVWEYSLVGARSARYIRADRAALLARAECHKSAAPTKPNPPPPPLPH